MQKLCATPLGLLLGLLCCVSVKASESFPSLYDDSHPFLSAIEKSKGPAFSQRITGITVPHHLVAADLIAEAFCRASRGKYGRIVILSPDHFRRSKTPFCVTRRHFRTVLGTVNADREAILRLLQNPLVSESELFSHEHGVQALLPFIAHYFPDSKVVPVAIRMDSKPEEWDSFALSVAPILSSETLVVQSTDFSHFLTQAEAKERDQETLRVLSVGDPEFVKSLKQPEHLDSRAAQYLQMRLQRDVFQARTTVTANRNSQDYFSDPISKTTSYIVQVYSPERLHVEAAEHYLFAGDTFFGRYMAKFLSDNKRRRKLVEDVLRTTMGRKLIVNLEGVVAKECPEKLGPYELCMKTDITLPMLKALNVKAVSLANNHTRDQGCDAYAGMKRLLTDCGIIVLENLSITDFGRFRLAAFTDVDNSDKEKLAVLRQQHLNALETSPRDKPIFAFVHWGGEYSERAGPRETLLGSALHRRGAELIIGCHSHRSSELLCQLGNCGIFSLGNFIFDQVGGQVSGKILDVMFFPQGTYFVKTVEIENFYDCRGGH